MKAKQKKLKELNERYLDLLEAQSDLGQQARTGCSDEVQARICKVNAALFETEGQLREALDDAMKDLGAAYLENLKQLKEISRQTVDEFKEQVARETSGTGRCKSLTSLSGFFSAASSAVDVHSQIEGQMKKVASYADSAEAYKSGKRPLTQMTEEALKRCEQVAPQEETR